MVLHVKYLPFDIVGICLCKGIILVRKDAPESTIAHEQVHESEWSIWWLVRYLMSPVFRVTAELRAYRVQAKIEHTPIVYYYETIRDHYLLTAKAKKLLSELIQQS